MEPGFVRDLQVMLSGMDPELDETRYRYVSVAADNATPIIEQAFAILREDEGVSAIVPQALADELEADGPLFARITLRVFSDLEGVGLTAAVATALAAEGIACNVVAALHHDHLLVPADKADQAISALKELQSKAND